MEKEFSSESLLSYRRIRALATEAIYGYILI